MFPISDSCKLHIPRVTVTMASLRGFKPEEAERATVQRALAGVLQPSTLTYRDRVRLASDPLLNVELGRFARSVEGVAGAAVCTGAFAAQRPGQMQPETSRKSRERNANLHRGLPVCAGCTTAMCGSSPCGSGSRPTHPSGAAACRGNHQQRPRGDLTVGHRPQSRQTRRTTPVAASAGAHTQHAEQAAGRMLPEHRVHAHAQHGVRSTHVLLHCAQVCAQHQQRPDGAKRAVAAHAAGGAAAAGPGCAAPAVTEKLQKGKRAAAARASGVCRVALLHTTLRVGRPSTILTSLPHPQPPTAGPQKYPMDFWAAARPRAQTTNQTLRMMGIYEGAANAGVHLSLPGLRPPGRAPARHALLASQ